MPPKDYLSYVFNLFLIELENQLMYSTIVQQTNSMIDPIKKAKISAVTVFLICGTLSTVAYKMMNNQEVLEGGIQKKFFHPYIQTLSMFLAESVWLLIFLCDKSKIIPLQAGKTPHSMWIFFLPALADAISTTLQYMALNFISGSSFLMFKGSSIVTIVIFSKIMFNMKIEIRHWIGCGSAIFGLVIVGASGYLQPSSGLDEKTNPTLGYVLMLISLVFNGFFYTYEQYLMRKHTIEPLQMIGTEGFFGVLIMGSVSLILSFIPCNFPKKYCVYDSKGNPYLERFDSFFSQLTSSASVGVFMLIGFVSLSLYNLNGVRITKLMDALTRSLLNITKTAIVWGVGICLTFIMASDPTFKIQSQNLGVNLVKIGGFAFIVFGTLTYNKLILKDYLESFSIEQKEHKELHEEKEEERKRHESVPDDSD